jgi:CS domain
VEVAVFAKKMTKDRVSVTIDEQQLDVVIRDEQVLILVHFRSLFGTCMSSWLVSGALSFGCTTSSDKEPCSRTVSQCLIFGDVLQGEQEYEMRVKLYDEVDSEQSRWEILSTKVRSTYALSPCSFPHPRGACIFAVPFCFQSSMPG